MTEAVPSEPTITLAPQSKAEDRVSVASNWQLVWWRFRKNPLAVASVVVLVLFYLIVMVPDFFTVQDPEATEAKSAFIPPQRPGISLDNQGLRVYVPAVVGKRNPTTLRMEWKIDPTKRVYLKFFVAGYAYKILGLIPSNIHLLGPADPSADKAFLLGTDRLGRDQWSRLMFGTRTSMTVGFLAVAVSIILGIFLGGISGYFGGATDMFIQRLIEILQSLPTIPIWLAMTAALPRDWPPARVFFAITIILALIGWTTLAREVRGRFLSLREEDFVLAAELAGCSQMRIINRHMVPAFSSHIIAAATLAIPVMIVYETSLSFLGLGIRPPAISWGVLLQEAQNIQVVAQAPWLMFPGIVVVIAVLAFNLVGDGLRDAADPYSH